MKRTFIFLLAFIMAGVTTYLFYQYTKGLKTVKTAASATPMVTVVVAKEEIAKNTQISKQMVALSQVPKKGVQPDAVQAIADVTGKMALVAIKPGETILAHHIEAPNQSPYLSHRIKPGFRAVTVAEKETADTVANLIEPGDRVDVVLSRKTKTSILLSDVNVLAVDRRMEPSDKDHPFKSYTMVTLEVRPQDALKIIDSRQKGKLTFILRGTTPTSEEG